MRLLALLAVALMASGCLSVHETSTTSIDSSTGTASAEPGAALGRLYLHAMGTRTWMDSTPGTASQQDTPLASVAGVSRLSSFPLDPAPASAVATAGFARVHLQAAADAVPADLEAFLRVDGREVSHQAAHGTSVDLFLTVPGRIAAGAPIELDICACGGSGSPAQGYVLDTHGGSSADFPASGPEGILSKGSVTVTPDGNGFRASRVDAAPLNVSLEHPAQTDLASTNGDALETQEPGTAPHLEADLWAHGDSEDQARARLETLFVQVSIQESPGLNLTAEVRTTDGGPQAWNGKGGDLKAILPVGTALSSATLSTTNGDVSSDGFAVGTLETDTTNGGVSATGSASSWTARTTNGGISGDLAAPSSSGLYALSSTNGDVRLTLRQDGTHGVDASASTTNGDATLSFADAQAVGSQSRTQAHVRTQGYEGKSVRTQITLSTTNGSAAAGES